MGIPVRAGLTIVLTLGVSASAAQVNLKELARRNGGRAVVISDAMLPVTSVAELVSQSDTIVHARIMHAVSKLTPDETRVVTAYELAPLRFFRQRAPAKSRIIRRGTSAPDDDAVIRRVDGLFFVSFVSM